MRKIVVVDPEEIDWEAVKELPDGAWIKKLSTERKQGHFRHYSNLIKGFMNHDITIHLTMTS